MKSAIYEGAVRHERLAPRPHAFKKRLFLLYLDLDELEQVFQRRWLWSVGRRNLVWFRRADYLGPHERPLREAVLDRVEQALGRRPSGAVRVLTQPRTWGYLFNPVSFYYVFDEEERLEAVVAEITNTPWNERHAYVLDGREPGPDATDATDDARPAALQARFAKDFHVSPFFPMEQSYLWRFDPPGETLGVRMTNHERGRAVFHVSLECERRPIDGPRLARMLLVHPFQTLLVHAAIYWQAARLWAKRTPFFVHPDKRAELGEATNP